VNKNEIRSGPEDSNLDSGIEGIEVILRTCVGVRVHLTEKNTVIYDFEDYPELSCIAVTEPNPDQPSMVEVSRFFGQPDCMAGLVFLGFLKVTDASPSEECVGAYIDWAASNPNESWELLDSHSAPLSNS
jgi:hypothetical protein